MNDKQIDDLFDQSIPDADSNARKIAVNSAMSEFSQAFEESTRPIGNRDTLFSKLPTAVRSFFMIKPSPPKISNTFATIAVAFIAVSVFFLLPREGNDSITTTPTELTVVPTELSRVVPMNENLEELASIITANNEDKKPSVIVDQPTIEVESDQALTEITQSSTPNNNDSEAHETGIDADSGKQTMANIAPEPKTNRIEQASHPRVKKVARDNTNPSASGPSLASLPNLAMADSAAPSVMLRSSKMASSEPAVAPEPRPDLNETYAEYQSNSIKRVSENPVSTFSVDVDTASYSLIRSQLTRGYLPAPQAVRAEELINYFDYDYALPTSNKQPFQPSISVLNSPWNQHKKLVHIGIKGYDIEKSTQPDSNIVFLLDVSGSMNAANKLPLVKQSIGLLLETLKPSDTVSIAVYAGAAGTVLEPTKVAEKSKILSAVDRLNAGGSTAGGAGIELAYQLAEQSFNKDAVNRIILATDGDFNVGQKSIESLKTLVERKRDKGVFLSILGFGRNNYQDDIMQTLAQNGNGVAAYIDTLSEAKKVLVDEATSSLFTIAKDVKLQIEFNPATVSDYRLVGYETRKLNREDFNNDKVDAGDIGAGHTVTAIYEITPMTAVKKSVDEPRYADNRSDKPITNNSMEYGFLKIRYKLPNGTKSKLIAKAIPSSTNDASPETEFALAVAGFAQLLSGGKYTSDLSYDGVIAAALKAKGRDDFGYRSEFIQLVRMAKIAKP